MAIKIKFNRKQLVCGNVCLSESFDSKPKLKMKGMFRSIQSQKVTVEDFVLLAFTMKQYEIVNWMSTMCSTAGVRVQARHTKISLQLVSPRYNYPAALKFLAAADNTSLQDLLTEQKVFHIVP